MIPTVALPDGTAVPAVGQGTWYMGDRAAEAKREADALRLNARWGVATPTRPDKTGRGGKPAKTA